MSFCSGSFKATVNVTAPKEEIILLMNPPITVEISETSQGLYTDYTHSMNTPINKAFDKPIKSVVVNDPVNDYIYSGQYPPTDPRVHRACPLPQIQGDKIYLDFDPGNYIDNSGSCTYRIFFGGWTLTITESNSNKIIRTYQSQPIFNVTCDDDCPEGSHKCTHNKYPGYCCVPCKETGDRLKNMANKVGR
jgi:hypothetical protein